MSKNRLIFIALLGGITTAAKAQLQWHTDRARGGGVGCQFEDQSGRPVDAYAIANGSDLSLVFTQLGTRVRVGPKGRRLISRCALTLPVSVAPGYALARWEQYLSYGIVKPAGIAAGINFNSAFERPRRDQVFAMPTYELRFGREQNLNEALAVAAVQREMFPENSSRYNGWRKRWCNREREVTLKFSSEVVLWSQRDQGENEVILAADGLDTKVNLRGMTEACANRVR